MDNALLISNVVLWILVIGLALTVLALARQIGVLYERIAPAGALMISQGPEVGEVAPAFELETLNSKAITVGGVPASDKSTLLFFLSPNCPVCDTLIPVLKSIHRTRVGKILSQSAQDKCRNSKANTTT